MTDPNQEYPYNISGAKPPPPPGEAGGPAPPPPSQDPPPASKPAPAPEVTPKPGQASETTPKPDPKPDTTTAPELKPGVKQEPQGAAAPAKKKPGLPPLLIVGVLLFGFAAAGLLFSLLAKVMADRRAKAAQPVPAAPVLEMVIEEVPVAQEEDEIASLAVVTKARRELPALTLEGIIYSEKEGSVALINGNIVPEGGTVKGVKVLRILSDKVELEFDGRRIFMRSL